MGQEEETVSHNYSINSNNNSAMGSSCGGGFDGGDFGAGSNGRSSKKQKQKQKVPQRGLGVAQLERIRLEEQQQIKLEHPYHPFHHGGSSSPLISSSPPRTSSSSKGHYLPHHQPFQNSMLINNNRHRQNYGSNFGSSHEWDHHHHQQQQQQQQQQQSISVPISGVISGGGGGGSSSSRGNSSMATPAWNLSSSANHDYSGSGFSSSGSSNVPNYESNPNPNSVWFHPWLVHKAAAAPQPPHPKCYPTPSSSTTCSYNSSMMNAPLIPTPISSSSMINFHTEPPPSSSTNQSYCSNFTSFGWPPAEEEKATKVGMKRAHPMSSSSNESGDPSHPNNFMQYHQNSHLTKQQFPSVVHHHHHHESPSSFNFGSGPVFNFSSPTHYFRDGCSGWNVTWQADTRRSMRENGSMAATFPGDFLTLAPPPPLPPSAPAPAAPTTTAPTAGEGCSSNNYRLEDPHFHPPTKKLELDSSLHSHHHYHHHHRGTGGMEDQMAGDANARASRFQQMMQQLEQQQQQQQQVVCQNSGCFPHKVIIERSSLVNNNANCTGDDHQKHENVDTNLKL